MLFPQLLNNVSLPDPPLNNKMYFVLDVDDKNIIVGYIDNILSSFNLKHLCDAEGNFPKRIIVNNVGKLNRADKSRSKMPSRDFKTYLLSHFDISALSDEKKGWVYEAIEMHLRGLSRQVRKETRDKLRAEGKLPPKKKRKTFKDMTEEEIRQARFNRIARMVEKAHQQNNEQTK